MPRLAGAKAGVSSLLQWYKDNMLLSRYWLFSCVSIEKITLTNVSICP